MDNKKNKDKSGSDSKTVDEILKKELKKFELKDANKVIDATRESLAISGVRVSKKDLCNATFIDRINVVGVVGVGRILENLREKTIPKEIDSISDIIIV